MKIERNFCQRFSLMDVYIILRLRHKQFSGKTEKNNSITRNEIRSDILKLLTFLSADAKSAIFLYFVATFYQMILPGLIHEQLVMSLQSLICQLDMSL